MEVGRPSDENSGGALLHADNADKAVKIGTSAKERVANTLESFIRHPFLSLFFYYREYATRRFRLAVEGYS
jgi:hypothetical protein